MGIDYYGVLNLNKCASKLEIKQAYRQLALELHPAKIQETTKCEKEVFVTFSMVGEAYDVLGDDFFRAVYDQYGEEGLKSGVPGPRQYIQPYVYHGDAMRTYQEFFGTQSPFADLLDVLIHPLPLYKDGMRIGVKKKDPDVFHPLPLTLCEVFYGGAKQALIRKRELCDPTQTESKMTISSEVLLTIRFAPGLAPGMQFRFSEAGNQGANIIPADIIFVSEDIPHQTFKREGEKKASNTIMEQKPKYDCSKRHLAALLDGETNEEYKFNSEESTKGNGCLSSMADISAVISINLSQALTGFTTRVNTIDGKLLRIPITDIVTPSYEKVIPGEGLPIFGDKNHRRGDLRLRFDISFPPLPFPNKSRLLIQQVFSSSLTATRTSEFDREDLNRSILAEKMSKVAVKDQAPPGKASIRN